MDFSIVENGEPWPIQRIATFNAIRWMLLFVIQQFFPQVIDFDPADHLGRINISRQELKKKLLTTYVFPMCFGVETPKHIGGYVSD